MRSSQASVSDYELPIHSHRALVVSQKTTIDLSVVSYGTVSYSMGSFLGGGGGVFVCLLACLLACLFAHLLARLLVSNSRTVITFF